MSSTQGNLFADVPRDLTAEQVVALLRTPDVRIERIVSTGQASPPDFWYDQPGAEWVLLVQGAAALRIEGEPEPRRLVPGSHVHIPRHVRHRVEWTQADPPTVWLAVYFPGRSGPDEAAQSPRSWLNRAHSEKEPCPADDFSNIIHPRPPI